MHWRPIPFRLACLQLYTYYFVHICSLSRIALQHGQQFAHRQESLRDCMMRKRFWVANVLVGCSVVSGRLAGRGERERRFSICGGSAGQHARPEAPGCGAAEPAGADSSCRLLSSSDWTQSMLLFSPME